MDEARMKAAFNEWMRRFTEAPEEFEREFESVNRFLSEELKGEVPSYGDRSTAYMLKLDAELSAKTGEVSA